MFSGDACQARQAAIKMDRRGHRKQRAARALTDYAPTSIGIVRKGDGDEKASQHNRKEGKSQGGGC